MIQANYRDLTDAQLEDYLAEDLFNDEMRRLYAKKMATDPAFRKDQAEKAAIQAKHHAPVDDGTAAYRKREERKFWGVVQGIGQGIEHISIWAFPPSAGIFAALHAAADDYRAAGGSLVEGAASYAAGRVLHWAGRAIGKVFAKAPTRQSLLGELAQQGVRHTPENVVAIARDASGRVVFLESGNARAGLQHIVQEHGAQFAQRGITEAQIPDAVMAAATRGRQVGMQGTRPIFEVEFNGQTQRIAVTVGDNGFIVGANPAGQ
jgi:hypothetical protein